ncbi:FkbM family methyltransferase [archaeon]|nr:MAG: FkbM family methyltransferase [archaeon]
MMISVLGHVFCLYSLLCFTGAQENQLPRHHHMHIHGVMAPFIFPQLYRCPISPSQIVTANETHSQANEDFWLFEQIFSKLPMEEQIGGTFLEIGALDGIVFSNSWFFEKKFGWKGILVEGHPLNQADLRRGLDQKRIRDNVAAFTAAICPLVDGAPGELLFTKIAGGVGTALNTTSKAFLDFWHKGDAGAFKTACVPMQMIIESTNLLDIDLFSLDVEGGELYILQTINFNVTNIRVIVVENDGHSPEKDDAVRALLKEKGFVNAEPTYGNIRDRCPNPRGWGCPSNEVYINPNYDKMSRKKNLVHYQYGTGTKCN